MRRVILMSWVAILSATIAGGVWAMERVAAKPCSTAIPPHAVTLAPVEDYPLAAGIIVAIDGKDGRLTIAHRGIRRFYLEPGTLVFHVQDRALLAGLAPGDKVRFDAARDGKRYDITRLENSN